MLTGIKDANYHMIHEFEEGSDEYVEMFEEIHSD